MTQRYEQRCRTLLRAYPPRYRATREDELLGTLLDVATPGRATPSVRQSWDIVRGGLTNRWRTRSVNGRWTFASYGLATAVRSAADRPPCES